MFLAADAPVICKSGMLNLTTKLASTAIDKYIDEMPLWTARVQQVASFNPFVNRSVRDTQYSISIKRCTFGLCAHSGNGKHSNRQTLIARYTWIYDMIGPSNVILNAIIHHFFLKTLHFRAQETSTRYKVPSIYVRYTQYYTKYLSHTLKHTRSNWRRRSNCLNQWCLDYWRMYAILGLYELHL